LKILLELTEKKLHELLPVLLTLLHSYFLMPFTGGLLSAC